MRSQTGVSAMNKNRLKMRVLMAGAIPISRREFDLSATALTSFLAHLEDHPEDSFLPVDVVLARYMPEDVDSIESLARIQIATVTALSKIQAMARSKEGQMTDQIAPALNESFPEF